MCYEDTAAGENDAKAHNAIIVASKLVVEELLILRNK